MRMRKPKKEFGAPKLTLVALIDVVLFLLLYFIIATELSPEESQQSTSLKTDARGGATSTLAPQVLTIAKGPTFTIGDRTITTRGALMAIASQLPKEAGIVVRVRDDADAGAVAMAIQVFHDAGFIRISYVAARK